MIRSKEYVRNLIDSKDGEILGSVLHEDELYYIINNYREFTTDHIREDDYQR